MKTKLILAVLCCFTVSAPAAEPDRTIIPLPEPAFEGKIGETYKDSEGAWPKLPAPPAGAPNVVVILLDDVGYALHVQDGKLIYHFNWFDEARTIITSSEPVPTGKSTVRFDFAYDGKPGELGKGGTGTLFINDKKVGEARIEKTVPGRCGIDTFGVGMDTGSPVSNTYQPPFAFSGMIHEVRVELR